MADELTARRWAVLRAVADCMVPEDEQESGWEAGFPGFIATMLDRDLRARRHELEQGLDALDLEAAGGFVEMSTRERSGLLGFLETGVPRTSWPIDASSFVSWLAALCAQGYYGDPDNGANRNEVSWRALGYRVLPAGHEWPAREPAPAPIIGLRDLRSHYDCVVIGAGAGGGIAAQVFAEAGRTVLLVERGAALSSDALPLDHLRSERSITGYPTRTGPPPDEPRTVARPGGVDTVFAPEPGWSANAFAVGGGTRVYGAQAWRFAPADFAMASRYGRPEGSALADWPIGYDDLEPWYDRCEWEYGVSGDADAPQYLGRRTRGYPMPALAGGPGDRMLQAGAARLGLSTSSVPFLINSMPRNGRPACVRCGACVGFACHAAAKNGAHNTSVPRALATGRCDLLTSTRAVRLGVDEHGRIAHVDLVFEDGEQHLRERVHAESVVVAAGAIETARLLLNSAHPREPQGIGNNHDLVGRTLQSHVYAGAIGIFAEVVQDSRGPGPTIATHHYRHDNDGIVGGGMLANDFVPTPLNAWGLLTDLGVIPRWGAASKAAMRDLWPRLQLVFGPAQEVPNPQSRVVVDPAMHDRFGIPVARLEGDIHPEDRRTAALLADRATDWLQASGAIEVIRLDAAQRPQGPSGGQHQAGTCRMGSSPKDGVTDEWGRVWGHPNLLIADGSVHVTNGGVNPVLTIMALAYRNTAHLVGSA